MATQSRTVQRAVAIGHPDRNRFWALTLGSVGVVYGDIGTSPLYAVREATNAAVGKAGITAEPVLGVLSLILWSLIVVVTLKYVVLLLRADNNGEGGTLALMALAHRAFPRASAVVLWLGLIGAGLFYGDAMLTPAISVLSAVEGLKIATPMFEPFVVPITVGILIVLFAVQSRGTAGIAALFGPITTLWFLALAVAGLAQIADNPSILAAIDPRHGAGFLLGNGKIGLLTLGAVFLAVTGAEALYADLGHFGRKPIRTAWLGLVMPALAINYLGQGALLIANPGAIDNPFFLMVPGWALLPMVALATAATVIASQAVITGAFSLSSQAIQLGLLPRLEIRHTSESQAGQIYMPRVNAILLIGVLLLVIIFQSSSELASAYGVAVSGTMLVTTLMAVAVVWRVWGWPLWMALAAITPLLLADYAFLTANLLKLLQGGFVPILIGGLLIVVMVTWRRGAALLRAKTRRLEAPLKDLVRMLEKKPPTRVPGTAIFLTADSDSAPTALLHSLKHYKVLHAQNAILTIVVEDMPRVPADQRVQMEKIGKAFSRIIIRCGFMETPDVQRALETARKRGWRYEPMQTSFFLSRRSLRQAPRSKMPNWQDRLFMLLARNADDASNYFRIPSDRVVEIGTQVKI